MKYGDFNLPSKFDEYVEQYGEDVVRTILDNCYDIKKAEEVLEYGDFQVADSIEDYVYDYLDSIGGPGGLSKDQLEIYFDYDKFINDVNIETIYYDTDDGRIVIIY